MPLASEAEITLVNPARLASRLTEHLVEHEIVFETRGGSTIAELGRARAILRVGSEALTVRAEADDAGDLEVLRSVLAEHLVEFADETIKIRWSGLPANPRFANFREIRLADVRDVSPRLRRLTFEGSDLSRFASDADLHVRLYFPPQGLSTPEWPVAGEDGRVAWPADDRRPEPRYYTIRSIDPSIGRLEIDFVLHEDGGPGATFAERGRAGDVLGMAGPLGRSLRRGDWHLLAGDETALPAIARLLETMPTDARGSAVIEIADAGEEIPLTAPPGMAVRWLHRDGEPAGTSKRLEETLRSIDIPDAAKPFVWVGCEFGLAKRLRPFFEKEQGLPRDRFLIVGYWSRDDE